MKRCLQHEDAGKVEKGAAAAAFQFEFELTHAKFPAIRFDRAVIEGCFDHTAARLKPMGNTLDIHFEGGPQGGTDGRVGGKTGEGCFFEETEIRLARADMLFPLAAFDSREGLPFDRLNAVSSAFADPQSEAVRPEIA